MSQQALGRKTRVRGDKPLTVQPAVALHDLNKAEQNRISAAALADKAVKSR